jgi:hypothetical protein
MPYTEHSSTVTAQVEMQDLHANVCEDIYDAAGLSIGVVSAVLLELIGQVRRYGREIGLQNSF